MNDIQQLRDQKQQKLDKKPTVLLENSHDLYNNLDFYKDGLDVPNSQDSLDSRSLNREDHRRQVMQHLEMPFDSEISKEMTPLESSVSDCEKDEFNKFVKTVSLKVNPGKKSSSNQLLKMFKNAKTLNSLTKLEFN